MRSSKRARKALTASNRHWGYMSIRAVRQTPYKKYNGTAPNERTDTVIPYRIEHVYVLESGLHFWPCMATACKVCSMHNSVKLLCARPEKDAQPFASSWGGTEDRNREFFSNSTLQF